MPCQEVPSGVQHDVVTVARRDELRGGPSSMSSDQTNQLEGTRLMMTQEQFMDVLAMNRAGKTFEEIDVETFDRVLSINVRGLCCLRPGMKGVSENIKVVSIIDRYLEHARIYCFRQGGRRQIFISSADLMSRNLSKRVELLVPVEDARARKRLLGVLETTFADTARARVLLADGSYKRAEPPPGSKPVRSQEVFAKEAAKRARAKTQAPDVLVPHVPKE